MPRRALDLGGLPDWPADMRPPVAAAYCGVSLATFQRLYQGLITPWRPTPGVVLYARADIDAARAKARARASNTIPAGDGWDDLKG